MRTFLKSFDTIPFSRLLAHSPVSSVLRQLAGARNACESVCFLALQSTYCGHRPAPTLTLFSHRVTRRYSGGFVEKVTPRENEQPWAEIGNASVKGGMNAGRRREQ